MNNKKGYYITDDGEIVYYTPLKSNEYINDGGEVRKCGEDNDNDNCPMWGTINNLYAGL